MPYTARFALLALAALLTACAGHSPAPEPTNPFPVVSDGSADDVLISAIGLVGTPYRYGGNTPDSGFDCSGLIGYVYRNSAGIQLPRSTREMINVDAPNGYKNISTDMSSHKCSLPKLPAIELASAKAGQGA